MARHTMDGSSSEGVIVRFVRRINKDEPSTVKKMENKNKEGNSKGSNFKIEDVGKKAELIFQEWLDFQKIGWFRIDQSKETFAVSFLRDRTKRPDYQITIPDLGSIVVDVKAFIVRFYKGSGHFCLDEKEIRKISSYHLKYLTPIWFAIIPRENLVCRIFYWISLNNVLKIPLKISRRSGDPFRPIQINDLNVITLGWNDGIEKLFRSHN